MCNRSELLDAQYPLHASKVLGSGFRPQGVTLHLYDMDICFLGLGFRFEVEGSGSGLKMNSDVFKV